MSNPNFFTEDQAREKVGMKVRSKYTTMHYSARAQGVVVKQSERSEGWRVVVKWEPEGYEESFNLNQYGALLYEVP